MIPLWENVKQMPKAPQNVFVIFYLLFFLYLLTLFFKIPLYLPDYAIVIITGVGLFLMGVGLLYGGIRELRLARQEARKPKFYKHMELYSGLAFILLACFFLSSLYYQNDMLFAIVNAVCAVIAVICLVPTVLHSVNAMNEAGVQAVAEANRKSKQEKEEQALIAQQGTTEHEGQPVSKGKSKKVGAIIQLVLSSVGLLAFFGCFLVFIFSDNGRGLRYEIPAIIFSIGCLLLGLAAISRSKDNARDTHRSWRWYQQRSVIDTIACLLFLLFYLTHLLLVIQHILPSNPANLLNIIPLFIIIAVVLANSWINRQHAHENFLSS